MGSSLSQPTSPLSEPAWSSLPGSRRSTFDLVQSCILTLVLCSWTAVHPDIPPHKRKRRWKYNKMFAALWAIVMPEYFLRMAFDELWESRLICLEWEKLKSTTAEQIDPPDEKPTPTVQSLPESNDTTEVSPANPSNTNLETHCTNHRGQSLTESKDITVGSSANPSHTNSETHCANNQGQSLTVSKDITVGSPANPSHANPKTHCTNHQGHNLKAHRFTIGKICCGLWHICCEKWSIVCETWRKVFPRELERGFYIEMGGFELMLDWAEVDGLYDPFSYKGRVTSRGAIELARHKLLPEVTLELINDQSKSDILTKVLVCFQAGWMIIQCIARVHQSLPLTLLEVHTLMHAICAFFIYCLWLKKPHDVMVTTKIQVDNKIFNKLRGIEDDINKLPWDKGGGGSFSFTEPWAVYGGPAKRLPTIAI